MNSISPEMVKIVDPWLNEGYQSRSSVLHDSKCINVAYIYDKPDNSTFRYRVYNMVECIQGQNTNMKASWFDLSEADLVISLLPKLHKLIICRVQICPDLTNLIFLARSAGVRIAYDCDDLVFDTRYAELIAYNIGINLNSSIEVHNWYAYVGRLNAAASLCDHGITTNAFLAEKMKNAFGFNTAIVPNFMNKRQQQHSEIIFKEKISRTKSDDNVRIGYFSGSPTHEKDIECAIDAINDIMREDDKVSFTGVGHLLSHDKLSHYGDRLKKLQFQHWIDLQYRISEVDINIAPLNLNDFTNCKSELKFFEASAVGTYTIASNSFVFSDAIKEVSFGMSVKNKDWHAALIKAIDLSRNKDVYNKHSAIGYDDVMSRYGWNQRFKDISEAVAL